METNKQLYKIRVTLPKRTIKSESGKFIVDITGGLLSFEPSESNPVYYIEEEHVLNPYLPVQIEKIPHLETLIIPEGIKSLPADFMRGYHVDSRLVFPSSLEEIGNIDWENMADEDHCVFVNTCLPEVFIPKTVKMIGTFAFGSSHIKRLVFEDIIQCEYARQFKDSQIDELVVPKAMYECDGIARNFKIHCGIGSLILK